MKPIGILMWEHRLIERVIGLLPDRVAGMRDTGKADTQFIRDAADFIMTYADRTHHGKEEDILFRMLAEKDMTPEHRKIMAELIDEHAYARNLTQRLVEANTLALQGRDSIPEITETLNALARFYPAHIFKEDRQFFFPCMEYFSNEELEGMMREFEIFDRRMIHEKYRAETERMLGRPIDWSPPGLVG